MNSYLTYPITYTLKSDLSAEKLEICKKDYEFDFLIIPTHFLFNKTDRLTEIKCSFTINKTEFKNFWLKNFAKDESHLDNNFENRYDIDIKVQDNGTLLYAQINHDGNFVIKINDQEKYDMFSTFEETSAEFTSSFLSSKISDCEREQTKLYIRNIIFWLFYSKIF